MKTFTLDRFEGEYGICQDLDTREIMQYKKNSLPQDAVEGDVLICKEGSFIIDQELTEKRRTQIRKLLDKLWQ